MAKDSGCSVWGSRNPFFITNMEVDMATKNMAAQKGAQKKTGTPKDKDIIAFRKKCSAEGTGLSHYILVSEKAKP
jgi:modified peptide precursor CbpA